MHYIRTLLVAGIVSIGAGTGAVAQQLGRSEAATAEQRLAEDIGADWRNLPVVLQNVQNLSEIVQKGDNNKASTIQNNPGNTANQAYIMQVGDYNEAMLRQMGSGNATRITQDGNDNKVTSAVKGDNNTTELNQYGDGNQLLRDVITNGADVKLTQTGNNNALIQRGTETLAPPKYEVDMRGNGIKLTIEQGRIGQ
ncbi:hypothetical protein HMJ29_06325 [Hymenobacter taeanensis]|uniref:Curlin n=1 Tax=Hymenobacter taeanensis TaxID=2735321 RepID=A0A6M6BH39_9BACT|nr:MULTISPECIES: hypothetical protein [Hymenobacter]QJX46573.1 hypothetical protein HMJ29_06325 [Hymenobacter taeanensis]UOQ80433.1 hypothetical protein MUN83_16640 [Hymenobacter sp. 5414T-23]